jgi:hypothetical protein
MTYARRLSFRPDWDRFAAFLAGRRDSARIDVVTRRIDVVTPSGRAGVLWPTIARRAGIRHGGRGCRVLDVCAVALGYMRFGFAALYARPMRSGYGRGVATGHKKAGTCPASFG